MVEVRAVPRGLGGWGDMVIVLEDGAKIEMRSVDRCGEKDQVSVSVGGGSPCAIAVGALHPLRKGLAGGWR